MGGGWHWSRKNVGVVPGCCAAGEDAAAGSQQTGGSGSRHLPRQPAALLPPQQTSHQVERVRAEMEVPLPSLAQLPEGERVALEGGRRRRCAELLANHCKKALAHITTHKVGTALVSP